MYDINLLPPELRPSEGISRKKLVLGFGVTTLVLFLGFFVLLPMAYYQAESEKIHHYSQEYALLQEKLQRVEFLEQKISRLGKEKEQLSRIIQKKSEWAKILNDFMDRIPQDVWLEHFAAGEDGTILMEGYSFSLASVGIMVDQLEQLSYTGLVTLVSAEQSLIRGIPVIKFSLTCQLRGAT